MAVGEQLGGGLGHVAVVLQIGLHAGHQLRLVLLVVGGERRQGLLVEALQLPGVLAHRREEQAVGAGVLEGEQREPLGLGDVRGQESLLSGPVEVDGILGAAASSHGDGEARQRGDELALQPLRRARQVAVLGGGHDRRHLGRLALGERPERAPAG